MAKTSIIGNQENLLEEVLKNNVDDQTINAGTNTKFSIRADDTGTAKLYLHGPATGTGELYIGKSATYGGGIIYNGDDNPNIPSTVDAISFFRRHANADHEVFYYEHDNDNVTFNGGIKFNTGITANKFSNDALSTSITSIPTENAVKTYVDNSVLHMIKNNVNNQTINAGTNTKFSIIASDTGIAELNIHGYTQGTGMLYVGQNSSVGGGIIYNGDDNPNIPSNVDAISFFRRESGTNHEVFYYRYDEDEITFNGELKCNDGINIKTGNLKIEENINEPAIFLSGASVAEGEIAWPIDQSFSMGILNHSSSYIERFNINTNGWINQTIDSTNNSNNIYEMYQDGNLRYVMNANGDLQNTNNSYGALSDSRIKENITDCTPKLDDLNNVRVVNFNIIGDDVKQIGVIAQEIEQIFPSIVTTKEDDPNEPTPEIPNIQSVKYSVLVPMLIKAVQELTERLEILETA